MWFLRWLTVDSFFLQYLQHKFFEVIPASTFSALLALSTPHRSLHPSCLAIFSNSWCILARALIESWSATGGWGSAELLEVEPTGWAGFLLVGYFSPGKALSWEMKRASLKMDGSSLLRLYPPTFRTFLQSMPRYISSSGCPASWAGYTSLLPEKKKREGWNLQPKNLSTAVLKTLPLKQ